jgi:MFS family permease
VLTDKTRSAKPWVVGGYTLAALSRPLMSLASSWPIVLALRFSDRVGKGLRSSPRDALLAKATPADQRGLAFGVHRSMDNAGAVIGPLLAAWLLTSHVPLKEIFMWAAIPGAITVLLALSIKEAPVEVELKKPFSWTMEGFPPVYKRYLLTMALFTLGNSSNMFLLLRAKDMGLPTAMVPVLWAITSASAMLLSTPLSSLSDRVGRTRLITVGWVIYGLFYLLLGLNGHHLWLLWPLFAFYGIFMAATEGAEKALVADIAPKEMLGTAYGWFNLTTGIMLLPASMIFGWLWQTISPEVAFGFSASCAILAAIMLKTWVVKNN